MNFFIFFKSKITISFLLFIVCASNGLAQETDVVYLAGEKVVKCTLLDITSKKVKYRDKAGKIISTDTDDAIMVFNKVGDFIIFPKKDIDPFLSSQFIRSTKLPQADFFITLEKKLLK